MKTAKQQRMVALVAQYQKEHDNAPLITADVAQWAVRKGYWSPPAELALRRCAGEIAEALALTMRTTPEGKRVRV